MAQHPDEILIWDVFPEKGRVLGLAVEHYPNAEPLIRFDHEHSYIARVLLRPLSMDAFVAAMFFFDALEERGHDLPELIIPFPFGARQDRLGHGNFLFTAKSMANMINQRGFSKVILLDPHSDVIAGMIDRCESVNPDQIIKAGFDATDEVLGAGYDAIVCPDAGAGKRALAVSQALGIPLIHAWKHRDLKTGAINGFGISPLPDDVTRVLVVDDACDGGGTFIGLFDEMRNAKRDSEFLADLYVTHGIFSAGTKMLTERYVNIFTTDSILRNPLDAPYGLTQYDGTTDIPVCKYLLQKGRL